MEGITVGKVKELKTELQDSLFELFYEIEQVTGMQVGYISLGRQEKKMVNDVPYEVDFNPDEKRPLREVKVNLELSV